jgi:hypothetical protein
MSILDACVQQLLSHLTCTSNNIHFVLSYAVDSANELSYEGLTLAVVGSFDLQCHVDWEILLYVVQP